MKICSYGARRCTITRFYPCPNLAPKMSNRKLRHDLDELKKEIVELRRELASRPTVYVLPPGLPPINPPVTIPQPYIQQPYFGGSWPSRAARWDGYASGL